MTDTTAQLELLEQKHTIIDIQETHKPQIKTDNEDEESNDECTLCEKHFDYIDLNKCKKCELSYCNKCFNGYVKLDSNGQVIDYEIGHEC